MAIKGGDLLHVGNQVLIERAQNAGPGQVNLNPSRIYELGNYQSLGTIFDIPDLTFGVESLDASAALEAILCGQDFDTLVDGDELDLSAAQPLDVASEFKPGKLAADPFAIVTSVAVPFLNLESLSYRFGLTDQAAQTASLRGDSIYYNPGSTYLETVAGSGVAAQEYTLAHKAYPYGGDLTDGTKYILGVKVRDTTGVTRLRYGNDYIETVTGSGATRTIKITVTAAVSVSGFIDVIYASDTVAEYPQISHTVPSATRPAAIRGRDITVYVGGELLSNKWTSVQAVTADWKVNLERDEEFGNYHVVDQDFTTPPDVSGTIQLKPRNPAELFEKIRQAAGVSSGHVVGANAAPPVELLIKLSSPVDGSILKCLYVPDARINVPGFQGQVNQKLNVTLNWQSDSGALTVIKGDKS